MIRNYVSIPLFVASISLSGSVMAEEASHWGYAGHSGPEHWGELDKDFIACSAGKNQAPIDLSGMVSAKLVPLDVEYKAHGGNEIINNGHSIQVNYAPGSDLVIDGKAFELKQFHFHAPSENTIEGKHYPMEAHFVHKDKNGNIAVLAIMYKQGAANAELEKAWAHMPHEAGEKAELSAAVSAKALLPKKLGYYRFSGSLTTPPCSEGVRWLVLKEHSTASKQQIEDFEHIMHHPNNRPVQPINARVILE
jgi:carbonic anhydrase